VFVGYFYTVHCENVIYYCVVLVEVLICEMFINAFNADVICTVAVIFCCYYFMEKIKPKINFSRILCKFCYSVVYNKNSIRSLFLL